MGQVAVPALTEPRVRIWDKDKNEYFARDGKPWVLWDGGAWFATAEKPVVLMSGKLRSARPPHRA